jgi:hypothetical protein
MEGIKKWIFTLVASIPGLFIELQRLISVVLFGCLTAYGLNRRMKRKGLSTGKFSSDKFFKMIVRFTFCAGGIIFCYFTDRFVSDDIQPLHFANRLTLPVCPGTAVSIPENITTENDDPPAVLIRKVPVSKAERHPEVDINSDGKIGDRDVADKTG